MSAGPSAVSAGGHGVDGSVARGLVWAAGASARSPVQRSGSQGLSGAGCTPGGQCSEGGGEGDGDS